MAPDQYSISCKHSCCSTAKIAQCYEPSATCVQLLWLSCVDYRLPKHVAAHVKREVAEANGDFLAPIYTESTIMSPIKRDEPEESDSRVDIQNPLFKDGKPLDPPHVAAAHHDSTVASIHGGSTLEPPESMHPCVHHQYQPPECGFCSATTSVCRTKWNTSMQGALSARSVHMLS